MSRAAPQITVNVSGVPAGHTATVRQTGDEMNQIVVVVIDSVEAGLGAYIRANRGNVGPALADTYGLKRSPR